eukprot:80464-Chlamydomonas_euryale.AAC.2
MLMRPAGRQDGRKRSVEVVGRAGHRQGRGGREAPTAGEGAFTRPPGVPSPPSIVGHPALPQ